VGPATDSSTARTCSTGDKRETFHSGPNLARGTGGTSHNFPEFYRGGVSGWSLSHRSKRQTPDREMSNLELNELSHLPAC